MCYSVGVLGIIGICFGRDGDGVSIVSRMIISGCIGFVMVMWVWIWVEVFWIILDFGCDMDFGGFDGINDVFVDW